MVGWTTGPGGPRLAVAELVNLPLYLIGLFSRTRFFVSLLFTFFVIRKITFIIRKMGFYCTKWNVGLQRTLVLRHFLTTKALQNDPRNIIVIYITREIKPSFYYPCVQLKKFRQARVFCRSRLQNFVDRDS